MEKEESVYKSSAGGLKKRAMSTFASAKPKSGVGWKDGKTERGPGVATALFGPAEPAEAAYEPIVKLVPTETVTGDEGWTVLFSESGKLFRWGRGNGGEQWKERATGTIKLLEYDADRSKVRLVVRRDQVLSVAANHYLGGATALKAMTDSKNAWTWSAQDVSDPDDPGVFLYAAKFRSKEVWEKFETVFGGAHGRTTMGAMAGVERETSKLVDAPRPTTTAAVHCPQCFTELAEGASICPACGLMTGHGKQLFQGTGELKTNHVVGKLPLTRTSCTITLYEDGDGRVWFEAVALPGATTLAAHHIPVEPTVKARPRDADIEAVWTVPASEKHGGTYTVIFKGFEVALAFRDAWIEGHATGPAEGVVASKASPEPSDDELFPSDSADELLENVFARASRGTAHGSQVFQASGFLYANAVGKPSLERTACEIVLYGRQTVWFEAKHGGEVLAAHYLSDARTLWHEKREYTETVWWTIEGAGRYRVGFSDVATLIAFRDVYSTSQRNEMMRGQSDDERGTMVFESTGSLDATVQGYTPLKRTECVVTLYDGGWNVWLGAVRDDGVIIADHCFSDVAELRVEQHHSGRTMVRWTVSRGFYDAGEFNVWFEEPDSMQAFQEEHRKARERGSGRTVEGYVRDGIQRLLDIRPAVDKGMG